MKFLIRFWPWKRIVELENQLQQERQKRELLEQMHNNAKEALKTKEQHMRSLATIIAIKGGLALLLLSTLVAHGQPVVRNDCTTNTLASAWFTNAVDASITNHGGGVAIISTNNTGLLFLRNPGDNTLSTVLGSPSLSKSIYGYQALWYEITNGTASSVDSEDTAFGHAALLALRGTNNSFTSAFGSGAGGNLVSGSGGAIFGQKAANGATNQNSMVAFGAKALGNCVYPARDTAVGYAAMQFSLGGDTNGANTGGSRTAVGFAAGQFDDGQQNTWVGASSGPQSHAAPQTTVGIGYAALGNGLTSSASQGVAIGFQAGYNLQQFIGTSIGYQAAFNATVNLGTTIGNQAGFNLGSINRTTLIGDNTASGWTGTALGDILIGYGAGNGSVNQRDHTIIFSQDDGNAFVDNVYFNNRLSASASTYPITINAVGGNGSNIGGAAMNVAGGQSTGNANGGSLNLQVSLPSGSSSTINSLVSEATLSGTNGVFIVNVGISSRSVNTSMTTTATGCTNSTGMVQIIYVTAATSSTLKDGAGNTEFSSVTISAFTPIRIQDGGKFTGTGITYAAGSASHGW